MGDYEALMNNEDEDEDEENPKIFITYKRRWFYLFVVCLAQISNALVRYHSLNSFV
jgi:hypothetical protein